MSTWSKSSLKLPPVVMSDKSFPTLGAGISSMPAPKKPVLSFAQKVKEKAEADEAAAAEAKQKADAERAEAQRSAGLSKERQVTLIASYYKTHTTTDEDYAHQDGSPDEMDYESALEYEEHLRYNRAARGRVIDYSKDLSSEDDEQADNEDAYNRAI